jgi:pyruvate,water dikinase
LRREEWAAYRAASPPADRFETTGWVGVGQNFRPEPPKSSPSPTDNAEERQGQGCCPGIVRAKVRVILDPRGAEIRPGEILVAPRTDPGWIMLFPPAAGLLVERGSLLSHSAIVARELRLPAVVAVPGLTAWLRTGDEVEFDGASGVIRRLVRSEGGAV